MAILGGVFIDTVYGDSVASSVVATDHAVEQGINVTDHVKANADSFSISGVIVGDNAFGRSAQIRKMMKDGKLVQYSNRIALYNVLIIDFNSDHDVEVTNGMKFTATLKEIATAKPSIIKENEPLTNYLSSLGIQQPIQTNSQMKVAEVTSTTNTIDKMAKSKGIDSDKLLDKNRYVVSDKLTRIPMGSNVVIPTR